LVVTEFPQPAGLGPLEHSQSLLGADSFAGAGVGEAVGVAAEAVPFDPRGAGFGDLDPVARALAKRGVGDCRMGALGFDHSDGSARAPISEFSVIDHRFATSRFKFDVDPFAGFFFFRAGEDNWF
jgi:hypothetical protein